MPQIPVICYLVLTVMEGLSILFDEGSESLLQFLDSELKASPHLLYEHVSLVYLPPPCCKHNFKVLFLELKFVSEIPTFCNTYIIKVSLEYSFKLFQRVIKTSQDTFSPNIFLDNSDIIYL